MRTLFIAVLLLTTLTASDMVHSFRSPAFNGIGYSSHMLTIENLARTRKQSIKDVAKAEAEQAKLQASNTPLNTFINNLQARIYSQLASQVTDAIFDSGEATFGVINLKEVLPLLGNAVETLLHYILLTQHQVQPPKSLYQSGRLNHQAANEVFITTFFTVIINRLRLNTN